MRLVVRSSLTVAVAILASLPGWRARADAQTAATTDTSQGLSITYADGRISTHPLRPVGGLFTPVFPRIAGADTARDGIPLTTLDVKYVVEGRDLVATVSLFYGGPNRNGVTVAKVRVSPERPVAVNELRAFGVEPIALALVAIPETAAPVPHVSSASAYLDVRAEPVGPNASAYRVTVRNTSPVPLIWFEFNAHRPGLPPIVGRRRGTRNLPLVLPDHEYAFEFGNSGSRRVPGDDAAAWPPLERVEVNSLMWQDGAVEGDPGPAIQQRALDISRAGQIRGLLKVLAGASQQPLASLRDQIAAAVPGVDAESEQLRDELRVQLDALERRQQFPDSPEFQAWLTRIWLDQQQWLARIVLPKL